MKLCTDFIVAEVVGDNKHRLADIIVKLWKRVVGVVHGVSIVGFDVIIQMKLIT